MTTPYSKDHRSGNTELPYRIRRLDTSEESSLLDLLGRCLNARPSPSYWRWKHQDSPFGPSHWLVAEADGGLVGARAFMRWQWKARGQYLEAVRAVDTATDPNWRRKGIFSNLTLSLVDDLRAQGVDFVFNTPNDKSRPGYLKMGWQNVTKLPIWFKPLRPSRLAARALPFLPGPTSQPLPPRDESSLRQLLDEPDLSTFLQFMWAGESRLHTSRTERYLRWRYLEMPGGHYQCKSTIDGERGAVVIYRVRHRGALRELMISELLVGSPRVPSIRAAQRLLCDLAKSCDADYMIGCAPRRTPEMMAFVAAGFGWIPRMGPILVCNPLQDRAELRDLSDWQRWRCAIGDVSVF